MTPISQSKEEMTALAWPSREVVAREIRRAMLDNPTVESFNRRAERREAIANDAADVIMARFEAARTIPQQPATGTVSVVGDGVREALECARQAIEYSLDMGGADPAGVLLQALNKCDAALAAGTTAGVDRGAQALHVVRQMVGAYDAGSLKMSSPQIGEPENDIPYHPWHEQLLHYARTAIEPEDGR